MTLVIPVRTPNPGGGNQTLTAGQAFQVNGSGFGTKSGGLSWLLDDHGQATAGTLDSQWTGGMGPNTSNPTYLNSNPQNRATNFAPTGTLIGTPHSSVSGILAGCHWLAASANSWEMWTSYKITSMPTYPCVLYYRYYARCNPDWSFTSGESTSDQGLKQDVWGNAPAIVPHCIYVGPDIGNPFSDNVAATKQLVITDNDAATIEASDRNAHGRWWGQYSNPFRAANGWILREVEICADQTTGPTGKGFYKIWDNGTLVCNYQGRTDSWTAGSRYITPGPSVYSRDYGLGFNNNTGAVANWAAISDVRIAMSGGSVSGRLARVVVRNAADTIRAAQTPTSWSDTVVQVGAFWQDKHASGSTVYVDIYPESGGSVQSFGPYTVT